MRGPGDLQRLSMLLVLSGLVTMYAASAVFSPEKVSIGEIGQDMIGESVRVEGEVKDLSHGQETVFFTLSGLKADIKAVHFGENLDIEEGQTYTFQGRVEVYRGELELVVKNVVSTGSPSPQPG